MGDLYVAHEWRGHGIARLLTASVEDFLKARGGAGYQVTVAAEGAERKKLVSLYRRLGFEDEGRSIFWRNI